MEVSQLDLESIYDKVLIDSGQFQLAKTKIELVYELFLKLTPSVLGLYSKHSPKVKNIYITSEGSRQYTFTTSNTVQGVPDWISDVVPIRILGTYPFYLRNQFDSPQSYLDIKTEFPWLYRNPVLTLPVSCDADVTAVYNHVITKDSSGLDQVATIDYSDETFFELLTGKFMLALGRARRSFHLEGVPITDDGDALITDGDSMVEKAMEKLINQDQKFYLAW